MKLYRSFHWFVLITVLISISGSWNTTTFAQSSSDWSVPQPIPFYDDYWAPIMIADNNRTVHAFNDNLMSDGRQGIFYRTWSLYNGWTQGVDIIIPDPSIAGPLLGVFLDNSGIFHMIYYLGSVYRGDINYSRAAAVEADRAYAWSSPKVVADGAFPLPDAALIGDGGQNLYIVYTGVAEGVGVYEIHSADGGETWSEPTSVFRSPIRNTVPFHNKLYLDKNGNLHALWSIVDEGGLGLAVYYARRDKDSGLWNEPYLIAAAEGNDYAADDAILIEYNDELIVVYMDGTIPMGVPPTRWMRRSFDNGDTWDAPVRPFPHVGGYGYPVMLIDSSNTLHIIVANRVGNPAIGGMWHGVWLGDKWSELELITAKSPEQALSIGSYVESLSAHSPTGVISQGNILLTAWWHNMQEPPPPGFSYKILDSPELPIEPLPSPVSESADNVTLTETSLADALSSTQAPDMGTDQSGDFPRQQAQTSNPSTLMLLAIMPAVLVVILFLVIRYFNRGN